MTIRLIPLFFIYHLYAIVTISSIFALLIWRNACKRRKSISLVRVINIVLIIITIPFVLSYVTIIYPFFIEPNWIQIEKLTIKNPNFPDDLKNLKIIHITDPHIEREGFRERSLAKKINALKPDLILITGDFITEKKFLNPMISTLSKLKAKKGIYGVLGDNDIAAFRGNNGIAILKNRFKGINIHILDNESVRIPLNAKEGLWLIGFTKPYINWKIVEYTYSGVNFLEPKILLAHQQQIMNKDYIDKEYADLVLVGDTHGTQIGLAFIRRLFPYVNEMHKYIAGLYHVNGVPLYVNRGIGLRIDSFRLFCRPEITLITLSNR